MAMPAPVAIAPSAPAATLSAEARALLAARPLPPPAGSWVLAGGDSSRVLEVGMGPGGALLAARACTVGPAIPALGRTALITLARLKERARPEPLAPVRFAWSDLARAFSDDCPSARDIEALRIAVADLADLAHRRIGLVDEPARGRRRETHTRSIVADRLVERNEPGARGSGPARTEVRPAPPLADALVRGWWGTTTPAHLRAAPTDLACRLALLAPFLTVGPADADGLCRAWLAAEPLPARPGIRDANPRRRRAVLAGAVAFVASDPRFDGSAIVADRVLLVRRG